MNPCNAKTAVSKPVASWAWRDDAGTWNPLLEESCRTIDAAKARGDDEVVVTSAGRSYEIDLKLLLQVCAELHAHHWTSNLQD